MPVSADLPKELEEAVQNEIDSGMYKSKSEFIRDAIRLKLLNSELDMRVIADSTREKLVEALKQVEEGETYSPEEVRERIG